MANRCATSQETWDIPERARRHNADEDAEADKFLARFRAICDRRAGRLITEHFWAWCAGCGAERVLCADYERKLVNGRACGLCSNCRPAPEDYAALRSWETLSPKNRQRMCYRAFAIDHFGKSIEECAVRAAADHHLPAARAAAIKAIKDGLYLSDEHRAILRLGTAQDLISLEAALAQIQCREAA
jgi:hypothetical protein